MCSIIVTINIEYIKRINFQYKELMVERLGKIKKKQWYLELFKYLHTNGVPYTVKDSAVLFTLNELEQTVVYELDNIVTKYE